ncbi:MAG TPA: glycosyltransferase family 4 protein [Pseudomonadales bacterium]
MSMRVLMTADTAGGVWVHALALCEGLSNADVEVRLVVLGRPSAEQRAAVARLGHVELIAHPVRLEWMSEPWEDLDGLEPELLAHAADCELVHLNHLVHGHLDWRRPVLCAVHSCVLSWHEAVRDAPAPPTWNRYRRRVAQSLRAADHVVAPSDWMLREADRHYGPLRRRSVIANGSDAPLGEPEATRRGVLAGGRVWDEAKNLAPLERLQGRLAEPLSIAGPRRAPEPGDADAGALPQPELWQAMRRVRVFVAPALYEPFGLGVLEAARSGCALVLGDIPTLRSLWDGCAVFVDPRRPETWQPEIDALLADRARRVELARAAQLRAAGYTVGRMAEGYLALYRRIAETAAMGMT